MYEGEEGVDVTVYLSFDFLNVLSSILSLMSDYRTQSFTPRSVTPGIGSGIGGIHRLTPADILDRRAK